MDALPLPQQQVAAPASEAAPTPSARVMGEWMDDVRAGTARLATRAARTLMAALGGPDEQKQKMDEIQRKLDEATHALAKANKRLESANQRAQTAETLSARRKTSLQEERAGHSLAKAKVDALQARVELMESQLAATRAKMLAALLDHQKALNQAFEGVGTAATPIPAVDNMGSLPPVEVAAPGEGSKRLRIDVST